MKDGNLIYKILCVLIVILAASYIGYGVYKNEISRITTEQAEITTVEDTVKTTGYVIRDEYRKNAYQKNISVLTGGDSGVYISTVTDGSKVAYGDPVALKFSDAKSAQVYQDLQNIKARIEYFEKLKKQNSISNSDLEALDDRICNYINEFVGDIDSQQLDRLPECINSIEKNVTLRQISTGEKINFKKIIKQLKKEYNALLNKYPYIIKINTPYAGYYIGTVDGYEGKADYSDVESLTVKKIKKLISSKPDEVDSNAYGKIIGEFEWYIACVIPYAAMSDLSENNYINVYFDDLSNVQLKMKVISIKPDGKGNVALILSSSDMNEKIAKMRIENITVVVKSYTGYKVSSEAIRTDEDGDIGVYVDYGGTAVFRHITIEHYGHNFAVITPSDSLDDSIVTELRLHDKVIVKGRNLKDGKLLSQ